MSSEAEKAAYWAARRGGTAGRQGERAAARKRARVLCCWVQPKPKSPAREYRWFAKPSKSERRKRVEARWAKRKRERAIAAANAHEQETVTIERPVSR